MPWWNPCCCGCRICDDPFERVANDDVNTGSPCGWTEFVNGVVDDAAAEIFDFGHSPPLTNRLRFTEENSRIISLRRRPTSSGLELSAFMQFANVGDVFVIVYARDDDDLENIVEAKIRFTLVNSTTVQIDVDDSPDPPRFASAAVEQDHFVHTCWEKGIGHLRVRWDAEGTYFAFRITEPTDSMTKWGFGVDEQGVGVILDGADALRTDTPQCGCGVPCLHCDEENGTPFSVGALVGTPAGTATCPTANCDELGGGIILIQQVGFEGLADSPCTYLFRKPFVCEGGEDPPISHPFADYSLQFIGDEVTEIAGIAAGVAVNNVPTAGWQSAELPWRQNCRAEVNLPQINNTDTYCDYDGVTFLKLANT